MKRKLACLVAAFGLAAVPAFASTAMHKEAAAPVHKVAMHKTIAKKHWHAAMHKTAWNRRTLGDREINALNVLEAAGYRTFKDMHVQGQDVAIQVTKKGASKNLLVTPAGKIMPAA